MAFIKEKNAQLLMRAMNYLRPYRMWFSLAFATVILRVVLDVLQPLVWGTLVARLFDKDLNGAIQSILSILTIYVLQTLIGLLNSYLFAKLENNISNDIKLDMYTKILDMPVKAFDEMRTGDFISRLEGDAGAIAGIIVNQFVETFVDTFRALAIVATIFYIDTSLAIMVICVFPVIFYIYNKFAVKFRNKSKEIASLRDDYYSNIQQTIQGIREVKNLGIKESIHDIYFQIASKLKNESIKLSVMNSFSNVSIRTVNFVFQCLIMVYGTFLTVQGNISVEHFVAYTYYSSTLTFSLTNISRLNLGVQKMLVSLERIIEVLDNKLYKEEKYGIHTKKHLSGNIRFENVSFKYSDNANVLDRVNFEINCGRKIAIVGASGSGKSTIFNLILRFYSPYSGRITIDDVDIKEFDEKFLRLNISAVLQEPFLFNASIKENLLIVNSSVTMEEIEEACKAAYIHEYIKSLPQQYNTIIGENGITLSGGQKQRLAIARALIKKSRIILFDEATSSLDNESQLLVRQAINKISKTHTVIIIAHRLSTIIDVDEIIVIKDGKVVGQAPHNSLISSNNAYRQLYEIESNGYMSDKEVI